MNLELISFALCPFVQRSVITLKYKNADFKTTYIDLKNKPDWFLEISPLGKVPVLRVNDATTIFESAVINEYVDETIGTPLMAQDPLQRALERAWIAFSSDLYTLNYLIHLDRDEKSVEEKLTKLFTELNKIEPRVQGPFFRGIEFSLVDSSWAPLFMRLSLTPRIQKDPRWQTIPRVSNWSQSLLRLPAVQESVLPTFAEDHINYCKQLGSLLF